MRRTLHGDPVGLSRMADMLSRSSFYLQKNSVLDSKLLILPFGAVWGVCMYVNLCVREKQQTYIERERGRGKRKERREIKERRKGKVGREDLCPEVHGPCLIYLVYSQSLAEAPIC